MPYGLQDCSSGSNQSYPSSHSQARDFSLARYSRIAQVFIDKEVVFSISPQHFLKPSLGYAGINLWAFSPSAPATASSLNHFPAGFIGHAVVALLACFLFPPPPAACFRFAAGRGGGLSLWGLAPRTYYVFETHITDILILLYLYNSFVIYAPPHIRAGGKVPAIACKAANLRRARFLCAARKILRLKQKAAVKRIHGGAAKGIKKAPRKKRGAGGKIRG